MPLGIQRLVLLNEDRSFNKIIDQMVFDNYLDPEQKEIEAAFNELFFWLRFGKGLKIICDWSPVHAREYKPLAPEIKLKRRITRKRNLMKKKYPLFAEEFFNDWKLKLEGKGI